MWAYRMQGPGFVERYEVPDDTTPLGPHKVRLRLLVAGLCGSDMPRFNGTVVGRIPGPLSDGAPMHEVVAEVLESTSDRLQVGQRVVGTTGHTGLCEFLTTSDSLLIGVPDELDDVEAVTIQSLGTVLRAADELPDLSGCRTAVIGAGPIGLSFCHVLKQYGAGHVTAIDPIDRQDVAIRYGADEFVRMNSRHWLQTLSADERPQVTIEAVGHQHVTIGNAIAAVAQGGFVYGFGTPDDDDYVLDYRDIYERNLTLSSGHTIDDWPTVLEKGRDYLLKHREDFADYVSHVVAAAEAQTAYTLYARPQVGRLKVAIVNRDLTGS
ncbi:zinc-dependent alcohol dehydrogenase [Microlunatus endophyticus]